MTEIFWIHLVHIVLFSGLLLYVGSVGKKLPEFMFYLLMVLAIVILGYHIYKAWKLPEYAWVNYIHIFLIVPVFFIIGWFGKNTPSLYFELCIMLGFAAFGYHSYHLLREWSK